MPTTQVTSDPFSAALAAAEGIPASTGAKSKAEKELAKLEGDIKKALAKQQYAYQLQLQEQQQKASLEELQAKQAYEKPFSEAELTGFYNGQETLNKQQLTQQGQQFNQTIEQQVLDRELDNMKLELAKLTQQQQNAIAQGQLDLSREIETKKLALQTEIERGQLDLETYKTTGRMPDGTFTEGARAQRVSEAMEMAKITGRVVPSYATSAPSGNVGGFSYTDEASYNEAWRQATAAGTAPAAEMTDAAQQWRAQLGVQYAQTAAQLAQNPENYFEAAAFSRSGAADAARGYLADINNTGLGSNVGFRSAATGNLPGTASMQTVAGQGTPTNPAPGQAVEPPGGANRQNLAISQFLTENPGFTRQDAITWLASNPEGAAGMLQRAQERLGQVAPGSAQNTRTQISQFMTENPGFDEAAARAWLASNPEGAAGMLQRGNERLGLGTSTGRPESVYAGGSPTFNEGPSRSISNAEKVRAGEGEIYTTTMHADGTPAPQNTLPSGGFTDAFTTSQAAIPQTAQGIPTPAAAIANVGDPYSIEDRARLNQYGEVFKAGAHKLAPGALEAMSPTERSLFNSAARASGIRPEDFEQQFKRSRLQTQESALAL